MQEIVTNRLILKPLSQEHCTEQYVSWCNDPEVYLYLETCGGYTLELLCAYIQSVIDKQTLMWAIHIKETGMHIGNIKIDPIDTIKGSGEYGIMMGERTQWGKGYAKEASEAVIDYCFNDGPRLQKITLGVLGNNNRAVDLYYRMGFELEDLLKNHKVKNGISLDVLRMAMFNGNVSK